MNTGGRARDVSVMTSHAFPVALVTGHDQWVMAERFVDVGHWSVWLYFVRPEAQTFTHLYTDEVNLQMICNCPCVAFLYDDIQQC